MKKQYLISLLGITAISISLGNSFSSVFSSPVKTSNENSSNMVPSSMNSDINPADEYFAYSIEQVSMGNDHSAAVVNDGDTDHLYTWGLNAYGQLGTGTNDFDKHNTPQEIDIPGDDIEQISMGGNHSAAIVDDDLYTWGDNEYGQLGLGDETADKVSAPQKVDIESKDIDQISLGLNNSAAIVENNLYTWGLNDYDQLGLGDDFTDDTYNTPQEVISLNGKGEIEQLSLGYKTGGVVINESGGDSLYTWGYSPYGALGTDNSTSDPEKVDFANVAAPDIKQISMGGNHSGAIVNNTLYTWGRNNEGELGLGNVDEDSYSAPQEVTTLPEGTIEQISMGTADPKQYGFSSAVINDGENDHLYTWGDNSYGQLGYVTDDAIVNPTPKEVTDGLPTGDIKQVSEGLNDTGVIISDGNKEYLYTWGENFAGKLGLGEDFTGGSYSAPNEVWGTPYVDTINSSATPDEDNPGEVVINYDFLTNLNVQDVTIDISSTDELVEPQTVTNTPDSSGEGKYSGEETFSSLFGEPGTTKYTYTISLNYSTHDGSKEIKEIATGTFDPYDATTPSTIEAIYDNDEVTINGTNSASVDYKVAPGKDAYDNSLTVTKVQWMNGEKEIASSTDEAGTLTAEELTPNTTYENTSIIATMSDETTTDEVAINPFKTDPCAIVDSTINQDGDVNLISPTEASVKYEIKAGSNEGGIISTVSEVKWIDGYGTDDEVILATNDAGNLTGTLTTKDLKANTPYANTSIVATMSYGEPITASIEEFTTDAANEPSIITTEKVTDIGQTTASVDYTVTPGADVWGDPVTVDTVQWIDHNDNDKEIASSTTQNGTLEATDLAINKEYNNTTAVATMSDDSIAEASINEFKTEVGTEESTIEQGAEGVQVTGPSSATFDYIVTPGKDENGKPVTVTNVQWFDDKEVEIASSTSKEASGTLEATDLAINTEYNNTTVVATMSDGSITNTIDDITFKTDEGTTKSEITVDDAVVIKGPDEATIGYEVTPGTNADGDALTTKEVQWIDNDDTSGDNVIARDTIGKYEGLDETLEANFLTAGKEYKNTTVIAIMNDDSEIIAAPVNSFTTDDSNQTESTIIMRNKNITDTSATFGYHATNGKDAAGNDYILSELKVIDDKGNILESSTSEKGNLPISDSFTITDLTSNTSYDNLTLVSTFDNSEASGNKEQKLFTNIPKFETLYTNPIVNDPNLMEVNQTNGTLEVQGSISENDTEVIGVAILKDGHDVTSTSTLEATNINNEVNYDVLTTDYDDNSKYELLITYSFEGGTNQSIDPYLLDQDNFSFVGSNPNILASLNPWVIIGSIIGFIVFALVSIKIGINFFRHSRKGN